MNTETLEVLGHWWSVYFEIIKQCTAFIDVRY